MYTPGQVSKREWHWAIAVAALIVAVAALPYVLAWLSVPAGKFFTGLLVNPLDGETYLAKMQQGAAGEWLFRLPFTPESQHGAFINAYYLFLGHVSGFTGIPAVVVYHCARCLAGMLLLLVVYRFVAEFFVEVRQRRMAFLFVALSSGVGWALAVFGVVGIDLWVPESNTFYSIFVNPHFPLAEALMLVVFLSAAAPLGGIHTIEPRPRGGAPGRAVGRWALCVLASLALACVQPFGLLVVYPVLGLFLLWRSGTEHRRLVSAWLRTFSAGVASLPLLVYYLDVSRNDPVLAAWAAQNVTPTPAPWVVLAGYGFLVVLALLGVVWCARRRRGLFLVMWVAVNAVLLYAPFALQRRLLLGFHVPVALLAAFGVVGVLWEWLPARRRAVSLVTLLMVVPTTLLVLLVQVVGTLQAQWPLYITSEERGALSWLADETSPSELVLASPEMGLMIPAWSGNRVIYGHPFETVRAEERKAAAESFFSGEVEPEGLLREYDVDYVFVGPHERALGDAAIEWAAASGSVAAYSSPEVTIYRVSQGSRE